MVAANGIQVASILAAVLNSLAAGQSSGSGPGPCKNGVRITKQQISAAKLKVTVDVFYDANCTTIFNHAVLTIVLTSASSLGITGQTTTYDPNGKAVAFGALVNTTKLGSPTTSVTTGSISLSRGGATVLAFGLSCSLSASNSCGFGGLTAIAALKQSLGVSADLQNFVASGKSSNGVVGMTAYSGALGGLKLREGPGTSWRVLGGKKVADFAGKFKESVNPKSLNVTGTIVLATGGSSGTIDTGQGSTTSASFDTRAGIGGGVVTQSRTGKRFATFSTDAVGAGSIDYSNGKTGDIVFYVITS
jgi:hypothetical protein